MEPLLLHDFHAGLGAHFLEVCGQEFVRDYGRTLREYDALRNAAGILDFSGRGRLCLTGTDRKSFLHGQVTNEVKGLKPGQGCYAALITAKGKMVSDLNIFCLENEILLDFEPGLTAKVRERLEHFIIADDVQVTDVAPDYALLSIQGPRAGEVIRQLEWGVDLPAAKLRFISHLSDTLGECYLMDQPRLSTIGFDLFVPTPSLRPVAERLAGIIKTLDAHFCGWDAYNVARIESGIPRFGVDMDESIMPPEAGLEEIAISYSKGCYIGQEIISRIRTYGQVAKVLRGMRLKKETSIPKRGDKLFKDGREAGFITSAAFSPVWNATIALGYVRREFNSLGAELTLEAGDGPAPIEIVDLRRGLSGG